MKEEGPKFRRDIYQVKEKISPIIQAARTYFENLTKGDPESLYSAFEYFVDILKSENIVLTKDDVKVLEIGSGNAEFLNFAKKQGVDITGVDINPRGFTKESQVLARIEQLPFPDGTFEVILSTGVFDGMFYDQNQIMMMKEIYRVLKSGGIYMGNEFRDMPQVEGLVLQDKNFNLFKKL